MDGCYLGGGGFPIEEIESNVDVVTSHVGGGMM